MIAAGNADAYAQVGKSVYLIFMRLVNRIGSTIPQTLPWVQKLIIRYLCITGIHCWDLVAGALIVKEAGGTLVDPQAFPGAKVTGAEKHSRKNNDESDYSRHF